MNRQYRIMAILACLAAMGMSACSNDQGTAVQTLCTAGATQCAENVVQVCGEDGSWSTQTDCTMQNQVCSANDNGAACTTSAQPDSRCTEGTIQCDDAGLNVLRCNGDGEFEVYQACNADTQSCKIVDGTAQCSDNSVTPDPDPDPEPVAECEAGQTQCNGDIVQTCGEDGKWTASTNCSDNEDDNKICEVRDGAAACVAECTGGATKCGGLEVLTCADGVYAATQTCDENTESCKIVDGNATCQIKPVTPDPADKECEIGQTKCDGSVVVSCNAQYKWENGADCSANETDDKNCVVADDVASCSAVCTSGYSYCKDGKVFICNDEGIFLESQTCDEATQLCQDNGAGAASCGVRPDEPEVCPEDMVNSCELGGILRYCDENGYIATKTCADLGESYICRTNDGTAECFEAECNEGETSCPNLRQVTRCENGVKVTISCKTIHDDANNFRCYAYNGIYDCREVDETNQDSDGDTIPDSVEGRILNTDTDGDTVPDYLDWDSDGDTIPDSVEGTGDADGDGIPNFRDTDSDGNGIPDMYEGCPSDAYKYTGEGSPVKPKDKDSACNNPVDTDSDGTPDYLDLDNDGDTIADAIEIRGQSLGSHTNANTFSGNCVGGNSIGTAASPVDCNKDGTPDYMSADSDGDTLPDSLEGIIFKGDVYARYSTDTDGDTVPDSVEGKTTNGILPDADGDGMPDIISLDSDSDGLSDAIEYKLQNNNDICKNLNLRVNKDSDGDGYQDAAEYAVAQKSNGKYTPAQMVCNKAVGIKNVYEFYFELPVGSTGDDILTFIPKVSKLDVHFNMDTTGSMGNAVTNLKNRIKDYIVPQARARVSDSAFGVSGFDDFPVNGYGYSSYGDLPFRLYGTISDNINTVTTNVAKLTLHSGGDDPESGYESLYQIISGAGVSWQGGYLASRTPSSGRWGGVDFRNNTMPVVVHITDTYSHNSDYKPYNTSYVYSPHYSSAVYSAYTAKGARIVTIYRGGGTKQHDQLVDMSKKTNATVPVCAFKTSSNAWKCGTNKCCVTTSSTGIDPTSNQCVLAYSISSDASTMSETLIDGLDALVKYGTYEVSTQIRGDAIGNGNNTSCFIDHIEAVSYEAPPAEPEKSCNPKATPAKIKATAYNDGFKNFATGTSSSSKTGAKLKFKVYAKNNGCYTPGPDTKVFTAYIDVYNPTTGLLFDTQQVAIVVPGVPEQANN